MIVSKTPLRVSFAGGGSDMPDFYEVHGGAVVSTAIDKWIRVIVSRRFEGDIRVAYSRTETVERADQVEHELVREALRLTGLPRGLDIVTLADVPSRGTGLGSSSASRSGCSRLCTPSRGSSAPPRRWPSRPVRSRSTCSGSRSAARTSTRSPSAAST